MSDNLSGTQLFDAVQAQTDLTFVLAGVPALRDCAVKSYRKMREDKEIDWRTILAGRAEGGRAGAGVLVAMPTLACRNPNITGPVLDWEFPVVCLEQPTINMDPVQGCLITAEELIQVVMNCLHLHVDDAYGTFSVQRGSAGEPEKEWVFPGTIGYRVTFVVVGKATQTPRSAAVVLADDGSGTITATCATAGAQIFYTTDGSQPAQPLAGNPSSKLYQGPFAAAGALVRAVAVAGGNLSAVAQKQASGGA